MSGQGQQIQPENLRELDPVTGKSLLEGSAAYAPFLQNRLFNTSTREVRQLWAEGFDAAVNLFNKLIELDRRMKSKDQDNEYNVATAKAKQLVADYKQLQEIAVAKLHLLQNAQLKDTSQRSSFTEITKELKALIAETVELEKLRKECVASTKELVAQPQTDSSTQKAHEESRLQERDDVNQDPCVFSTQVERAYGHPKAHPTVTHSSVEYAIESIFPALNDFLTAQKEFLADQRPNLLSRLIRALPPFRWFSFFTDTVKFVEAHQKFVTQTEQKIKIEKQGLAGAAFNRLNSELISSTFTEKRFETFADFVKENGNFAVVNVPRSDIDGHNGLLAFIQAEKEKNLHDNRRGFFSRIWHGGQSEEYIERKNYLDNLTAQIATQRTDLRTLQGENGDVTTQQKFQNLLNRYLISVFGADASNEPKIKGNYSNLINNDLFVSDDQGQSVKASVKDFSDFIETHIKVLEQNNADLKKAWFSSFGESGKTIKANKAGITYLQKIKHSIDNTSADEFNASEAIKLVVDTKTQSDAKPYSVEFLKQYNKNRVAQGQSELCPNGLMQLANEVITLTQATNRDFFREIVESFNNHLAKGKVKIVLVDIKTDSQTAEEKAKDTIARQKALDELMLRWEEFLQQRRTRNSTFGFIDLIEVFNQYRTAEEKIDITDINADADTAGDQEADKQASKKALEALLQPIRIPEKKRDFLVELFETFNLNLAIGQKISVDSIKNAVDKQADQTARSNALIALKNIKLAINQQTIKIKKALRKNQLDQAKTFLNTLNDYFADDQKITIDTFIQTYLDSKNNKEERQKALLSLNEKADLVALVAKKYKPGFENDAGRMFFDYLQNIALELSKPYRTLADRTDSRINTSLNSLVNIILYNGVTDKLIEVVKKYINLLIYAIENDKFDITQLSHVSSKEEAKGDFLTALKLVKAIVNGDSEFSDGAKVLDINQKVDRDKMEKLCSMIVSSEKLQPLGQYSFARLLVTKFTAYHLRDKLNQQNRQKDTISTNAHTCMELIKQFTQLDPERQYRSVATQGLLFFTHLFCTNPGKAPLIYISAGHERSLIDNPENANIDHDQAIIAKKASTTSSLTFNEKYFISGEIAFAKTIQEVYRQQNRVSLFPDKNKVKEEMVEQYIDKYDGKNTAYAEVISIVGTEKQIQSYAKKLLKIIFSHFEIKLTSAQQKFIDDNKHILQETIHGVIDTYISSGYPWNPVTENLIHKIGSADNKQRYTNKRIKELLIHNDEKSVRYYIAKLQQREGFTYPDFNNKKAVKELTDVFEVLVENGAHGIVPDLLADYLLQAQRPDILQQLRINELTQLLTAKTTAEKDKLQLAIEFIRYLNKDGRTITKGILDETGYENGELRNRGKEKINTLFAEFLATTDKEWFAFAEHLMVAFDEDQNNLQTLRLRKIALLLKQSEVLAELDDIFGEFTPIAEFAFVTEAQKYIDFVKKSDVETLLCATDSSTLEAGKIELDTLFRNAIFDQVDNKYQWNLGAEQLIQQWGTPEHKDLCAIAKLMSKCIYQYAALDKSKPAAQALLLEKTILELESSGFRKGKLVTTSEGKQVLKIFLEGEMNKGVWNLETELLLEYFEPEDSQHRLLHEYRLKRFKEIMTSTGVAAGYYDLTQEKESIASSKKYFEREEFIKYQNLKISQGGEGGDIRKLKHYFGEVCLQEVRKLLTEYVNKFGKVENPDPDAYSLCSLLLSDSLSAETINGERGSLKLNDLWTERRRNYEYLKDIPKKIASIQLYLKVEDYEGAKASYDSEVALMNTAGLVSKTTDEYLTAQKIVVGIELSVLEFVKELVREQKNTVLQNIKTNFVDHMASDVVKKKALAVILQAKEINKAYEEINHTLNTINSHMFDISDQSYKWAIEGLDRERKTLLLQKIEQLLEETKDQSFYANPHDILKALADSIKSGTVDLHYTGKLHLYKNQSEEVNKRYKEFVAGLDVMQAGGMLNFNIFDFIFLLDRLDVHAKRILEEKIAELKGIFNAGELPTFGDPIAILEEISAAIQSTHLSSDFEEKLQAYQEGYEARSSAINDAFKKIYLPLNQLHIHLVSKAAPEIVKDGINKLENILIFLSVKEFEMLMTELDQNDKDRFVKQSHEIRTNLSEPDSLKSVLQLFEDVIKDPSQLDKYKQLLQELQAKMKLTAMVQLYSALDIDQTSLLKYGLHAENKRVSKSSVLKPTVHASSYPKGIYASLAPNKGFNSGFINQISADTAVNYIVHQYLLKRLEIANDSNEKNRTSELTKLQKALVDFVITKNVNCGSALHHAIIRKFWKILEPELANRQDITSTEVDALRIIALTQPEFKVTVTTPLKIIDHSALPATPFVSPSSVKIEQGSSASATPKSVSPAVAYGLAKAGSPAGSHFFASSPVVSPLAPTTSTIAINKKPIDDDNEDSFIGAPPKPSSSIDVKKPSKFSVSNEESSAPLPQAMDALQDDIFDLELGDDENASNVASSSSSAQGRKS